MRPIKHTSPTKPKFGATVGDNALATVKDVNQVIDELNNFNANQFITALPGGGQTDATQLIIGLNVVTTATDLDSVLLPCLNPCPGNPCACGVPDAPEDPVAPVIVKNEGPGILSIYPCVGSSIDGGTVNAPLSLPADSSVILSKTSCDNWTSYSYTTDSGTTGVLTVTGCNVDNTDPLNPVIGPVTVDNVTITGTGCVGDPLVAVAGTVGYAEYVQHSAQAPIAPGTAIEFLTNNPAGVFNTLGITTTTGPGAIGTEFLLPIGTYMIDFETSADAAWSLAIYKSLVTQLEAIDTNTIAGASTATTWIHGRAIINAVAPTYFIISPVTGTQSIPTAGTAAGEFIARLTILKIA